MQKFDCNCYLFQKIAFCNDERQINDNIISVRQMTIIRNVRDQLSRRNYALTEDRLLDYKFDAPPIGLTQRTSRECVKGQLIQT